LDGARLSVARRRTIALLLGFGLATAGLCFAAENQLQDAGSSFVVSYRAGDRDANAHFMGGTELRNLAAYQGKLYAGNGYWEDRPGDEGPQGAQILVLDTASSRWRVERSLEENLPNGRPRNLAISALGGVTFGTDNGGKALAAPVSMLLAGTWDLSGFSQIYSRDDKTGTWSSALLPAPRVASGIQQIRALGTHRDRATGVDRVFLGNEPFGIYSGAFDAASGRLSWGSAPELDIAQISAPPSPGLSLRRVSSFAECNGTLYAAVGQQIYRRVDGAVPRWQLLYTNPKPGYSETGLRGLTAIPNPQGAGQVLLVAVEGYAGRMLRIDPTSGEETAELDIQAFLDRIWGTKVTYIIAAYNDMTPIVDPSGGTTVLIGIEAFIPATAPVPEGHQRVEGLEAGAWYLVRRPDGRYNLKPIAKGQPTQAPLIATRAIAVSPFADDAGTIYFAGYDANKLPAHNTAWIMRAPMTTALAPPPARAP
jgi:poly(A) polymerase